MNNYQTKCLPEDNGSVARVPALRLRGHGFESRYIEWFVDYINIAWKMVWKIQVAEWTIKLKINCDLSYLN